MFLMHIPVLPLPILRWLILIIGAKGFFPYLKLFKVKTIIQYQLIAKYWSDTRGFNHKMFMVF